MTSWIQITQLFIRAVMALGRILPAFNQRAGEQATEVMQQKQRALEIGSGI